MRGLFGDFSTMPLEDLVVYLGKKRATGVLGIEHDGLRKQVVIRDGRVINASSNEPREHLGRFLINLGHITEAQAEKAYATQQETRVFLGKILVMIGAVNEETIANALSLKVRETLLQAFHWKDGRFNFDPGATPELQNGFDVAVDLLEVHREGEFRRSAWRMIRGAFPSGMVRLALVDQNLPEAPKAESLDDRLFRLIRQGRTIDEMIAALHAPDFFLYQRLYALHRLDALRVVAEDPPAVMGSVGEESDLLEMLSRAENLLDAGRFEEAEPVVRQVHVTSSTSETAALVRRAELGLAAMLRRSFIDGTAIAAVAVPQSRLDQVILTAPERYLLSRIDGSRDVSTIVQMSPVHELQALKILKRFLDTGLIRIRGR